MLMKKYNVAIVGATGVVGRMFLKVLEERGLEFNTLKLYASKRSAGEEVIYKGKKYIIEDLALADFKNIDFALFSAGKDVSKEYAPKFASSGAYVIDNSSCFRMDEDVPLIVPEINLLDYKQNKIIANPNCSTIQSVLPLAYLKEKFGLKRVVYTTYQAVSGSGMKGIKDLEKTLKGEKEEFYPYNISKTCIPQIDDFLDNHYTKEEMKMVNETRKILHDENIKIAATCVRVPVLNSHAVVIACELEKEFNTQEIFDLFKDKPGIKLVDDIGNKIYPLSILSNDNDLVYVGRIRKDISCDNGIIFYTVADNLRKGAASNAIDIMIKIMEDLND